MMEEYMPGCCSYYSASDLAANDVRRAEDRIRELEKRLKAIEPKRGKWVDHIRDYWCSECGGRIQEEQAKRFSICPYCGAQMERSEDGET